ncbi:unnamed protein product [Ilex paraguariensis]|uniref:Uncharacterized protein n=1 Tax=Ilex paraguariensis TaxID=185542 RepID=A0ABC8TPL5_9AQUA
MSEVIAGSDPSTEANTGFDASRIAKVKAWLVSQFDAARKDVSDFDRIAKVKAWLVSQFDAAGKDVSDFEKDVSDFEYTPQSIAHLHNLANISQEKTQAAGIVAKDFCQKASEYHSQAARYPECCCHQNTWFGKKRKALLQDIAILTGAEYQARDLGLLIENTSVEQLGLARKVTVSQDSRTIIADAAIKDEIQAKIAQIKNELLGTDFVYDSEACRANCQVL